MRTPHCCCSPPHDDVLAANVTALATRGVLELAEPRQGVVPWPEGLVPLASGSAAAGNLAVDKRFKITAISQSEWGHVFEKQRGSNMVAVCLHCACACVAPCSSYCSVFKRATASICSGCIAYFRPQHVETSTPHVDETQPVGCRSPVAPTSAAAHNFDGPTRLVYRTEHTRARRVGRTACGVASVANLIRIQHTM